MRRLALSLLVLAASTGAAVLPAAAIPFEDPATGLKIDPPQPFVVAPAKSKTYDVAAVINSLTGAPPLGAGDNYLCQLGFKKLPDNADFAQEEINLQVEKPEWLDNAAAAMSKTFDVTGKSTFVLNGAAGIELVGKPKGGTPGAAVFVSMVDTPIGRTTLNCATRPEEIEKAVNQFRLIRASITLPGTTP